MLRFVIKLRHSFFLGHPYYEDWLSQVIMAALNIKTMKFSNNFSDSVEEPSEIMDNSRPNGVCATCHPYHNHYYYKLDNSRPNGVRTTYHHYLITIVVHLVLTADNSRPNGVYTKYHHFCFCPVLD